MRQYDDCKRLIWTSLRGVQKYFEFSDKIEFFIVFFLIRIWLHATTSESASGLLPLLHQDFWYSIDSEKFIPLHTTIFNFFHTIEIFVQRSLDSFWQEICRGHQNSRPAWAASNSYWLPSENYDMPDVHRINEVTFDSIVQAIDLFHRTANDLRPSPENRSWFQVYGLLYLHFIAQ